MNKLFQTAAIELADFLSKHLPSLSRDWWKSHVENRLSFHQQRRVRERGLKKLEQLDFAALLRLLDQNWYELSQMLNLPREGRTWVKELQTVRNKWAHLSAESLAASEVYRDADTLGRLFNMLAAGPESVAAVEAEKADAFAAMATERGVGTGPSEPAAGESKATDDGDTAIAGSRSPVNSVTTFQVGNLVALRTDPTILMPVVEVLSGGAECRYRVFRDNRMATYYESQLQGPDQTEELQSQLTAKELRSYLTSLQILSPSTSHLYSLRSGRIQFVPYQYRPVLKLIRADRPRLLIADEVGVGKTIEAGLIIKELRARMDISSVLVICPKALVAERKWFLEMKRFDEHFMTLDGPRLRHCLRETHLDGEWPDHYAKAILPFSLFDSNLLFGKNTRSRHKTQGLLALDPPPKFDLVIVDEAHHIRNSETYLHQGVRYFCDNAQAAVFLTATPVQLGSEDLFTLLNVLRPDLVIDHSSFEQMAAPNRPINMAIHYCRSAKEGWQREARTYLDEVAETRWGRLFLRESPVFQNIYDLLGEDQVDEAGRIGVIRDLEELYTFSPMINRTRRRDIGEFTTRKPETLTIEFTPDQRKLHDDLLDVVARILAISHGHQNVKFMMTTIRRQAASCLYGLAPLLRNILTGKLDSLETMELGDDETQFDFSFLAGVRHDIEALLERADNLDPRDPKVDAFVQVLREKAPRTNNKALVFSTFRHTLAYIERHTKGAGLRYGVVHGGVPDEERSNLRQRFALPKEDPEALDVMLSSEVGCEGLDYQFCDLLINYDLPWNPMRIEQRIGRIDRYGQESEAVAIVNLITPGTVDADIYERCLWRIGVFQHAVGSNEEILGEITREIHDIAERFKLTADERARQLQQLSDNSIRQIQEEHALEEKQADLFGLTVPNQSWRQEIEDAETTWLSPRALQLCVSTYLSGLVEAKGKFLLGKTPLKTLRLNQNVRTKLLDDYRCLPRSTDPVSRQWEKWLKGAAPMLSVTFDQETSVAVPSAVHLNVLHPLVRQAARYQERTEAVQVSLVVTSESLPTGEYPFALYQWQKVGLRPDDALIAIASEPKLDSAVLSLLVGAVDAHHEAPVDDKTLDILDRRHHEVWTVERANHVAENRELVQHRLQSLNVSHQARCKLLEEQVQRSTNDKIRLMKESELARAKFDYDRRVIDLEKAAISADVHATQVVYGVIAVTRSYLK